MKKIDITVNDTDTVMKISDYLKRKHGFSSALITKVKYGGVTVNGDTVTMRATVKKGDTITVTFTEDESESIPPINIPLNILYEDDYMIAVDKPSNMPTHPSRGNSLPTLANAIMAYMGEPFVFRSINRLDRGTSGIVIIAKDMYSSALLGRAMKERRIKKKYLALVKGIPSPSEGIIDAPIERMEEGNIKRVVREDGKSAITEYKVISINEDKNALCEILLHTGRTHQIRVHMAYIGHPLLDDFLYGDSDGDRFYLRCSEITLPHPKTNELITIKATP